MINYIDWAMLASVHDLHHVSLLFIAVINPYPFLKFTIFKLFLLNAHQQVQYYQLPMHSIACYIQTST